MAFSSRARCVLFFDEFETLGKERGDVHETGEMKRLVSSLLLQIDRLPSQVILIGATNHSELLDRAVWRRFQVHVALPGPTEAGLAALLSGMERRKSLSLGLPAEELARRLMAGLTASGRSVNFAEAEEFCLSVFRDYILDYPSRTMPEIVAETLGRWMAEKPALA